MRVSALCVCLFVWVCRAAATTTYDVSFGFGSSSITRNGTSLFAGSITTTSTTYSVFSSRVSWLITPTAVTSVSSLPSVLHSHATFLNSSGNAVASGGPANLQLLSTGSFNIYGAFYASNVPYVTVFGTMPSQHGFTCTATTMLARTPFSCGPLNSSVVFQASFTRAATGQGYSVSVTNSTSSLGSDLEDAMLTVAFIRLTAQSSSDSASVSIAATNSDRKSVNKSYVGVLWWFVVMMMFFIIRMTLAVQVYLWQPIKTGPNVDLKNMFLWVAIDLLILLIFILSLGVFGWLLVGAMFSIFSLVVWCVYCVVSYKKKKKGKSDDTPVELLESGSADDNSNVRIVTHEEMGLEKFTTYPQACGKPQKRLLLWGALGFSLFFFLFFILFFPSWTVEDYRIFDRQTRTSQVEFQPQNVAKAVASVYVFDRMATNLRLQGFFHWASDYCGNLYTETLSESERKQRIFDSFVDRYQIDMSIYDPPDWRLYSSVNAWFIRKLRPGVRPIAEPNDNKTITSPADARLMLFTKVRPDQKIWLKGHRFTLEELIGDGYPMASSMNGGSLAVVRLAPQDYHRYHTPVAGTIVYQYKIEGTLHSVNADAITSENNAILNQRTVSIIRTAEFGDVGFVAIGAVCVGSTIMTRHVGDFVQKGEEMGFFQFGGSTIALVFPPSAGAPRVVWDDDVLQHSNNRVEVLVEMGMRLGVRV